MSFRLGGLTAAPYTPFDESGDLRLETIEKQVEFLFRSGVKGVFVCGTTGEGLSLTIDERMRVAQRWMETAGQSLKVVVHVGHNSQRDAMELARHARRIGASAVAALPPFYYKPAGAALAEFLVPIAAAAGDLPFYYYHFPLMTGVSLSVAEFLDAARNRIPTLNGAKFTHTDLMDFQQAIALEAGRYEIAWGRDEMLLGALAVGAEAAIGSTYNFATPLYTKLMAAFRAGDLATAQSLSRRAVEMVAVMLKHGGLRTGKYAMSLAGVDCGPPRAPIARLTAEEERAIREAFEKLGVFGVR